MKPRAPRGNARLLPGTLASRAKASDRCAFATRAKAADSVRPRREVGAI